MYRTFGERMARAEHKIADIEQADLLRRTLRMMIKGKIGRWAVGVATTIALSFAGWLALTTINHSGRLSANEVEMRNVQEIVRDTSKDVKWLLRNHPKYIGEKE